MSIPTRPLTYDDLVQMPEDGNRYEIIGGELVVIPAPIPV
ncbi:MAG: Uma2 family endonuclease, partial [Chloroflexota bacterium]|nr:Uma2 family endonuclease [Chloroflexota bacterium]